MRRYHCDICGPFIVTAEANYALKNNEENHKISAWIREFAEKGQQEPEITTRTLNEIEDFPTHSPLQKQKILLQIIEGRTQHPGYPVGFYLDRDYPLGWAANRDEFIYLLNSLESRSFISQVEPELLDLANDYDYSCMIETSGWEYLDNKKNSYSNTDRAFVAMSFSDELSHIWTNAIKSAIEDAGYKAVRVDQEHHIEMIDSKIISEINDSRFIVADVTLQKQGVYFEAGYALGRNIPVIWCVKDSDLENVHFDTRQYNHIVWRDVNDLKENLYNRICAVIGRHNAALNAN